LAGTQKRAYHVTGRTDCQQKMFSCGRHLRLVLALLQGAGCLIAGGAVSKAQTPDCRALMADPHKKEDYQLRTNSERCEGFYAADVSRDGLLLTQLSFGPSLSGDPSVVEISIPRLSEVAQVSAIGTSAHLYYRMDALILPNKPLRWPLSDVLLQSHLHLNQFGVVAWIGADDGRIFVPVALKTDQSIKSVSVDSLLVGITSSVPLDALVWRWAEKEESQCHKYSAWQKIQHKGAIPPQKQVAIELPHSISGEICFEVQGQEHESDTWYPLNATIKIPK
jgi:hypothetical protein